LHNLSKEYGDISYFKFGKHYIYLINNPDYIKNVLVDQENNYINSRGLQLAKRILGEGLLTSEGELHHRQRQLIQPVFQPDEITSYANIHGNQPWFDHFSWIWHINNDNISMDSSTYLGCTSCSDTTWNYSLPSKKHTESPARQLMIAN
jgi:hypothetical protein